MKLKMSFSTILLILVSSTLSAQEDSFQLTEVAPKVTTYLLERRPGWQHRPRPDAANQRATVSHWERNGIIVRVAIFAPDIPRAEMAEAIREFATDEKATKVEGLGDEAYAHGKNGASVVFRMNNLTIAISTNAGDRVNRQMLVREFARLVADALRAT